MQLGREFQILKLALQFLTRLPVHATYDPQAMALAPRYFGVVGALIGAVGAGVLWLSAHGFGNLVACVLCLICVVVLTGALHEDGLADTADGVGGGATPEAALNIMRDSRIGAYGALALIAVFALRLAILFSVQSTSALAVAMLITAHAASRGSMLVVMFSGEYLRTDGAGRDMRSAVDVTALGINGATLMVLVALLLPFGAWLPALTGLVLGHVLARAFYQPKLNGYTGDCLGFVQQISEIGFCLGILAWL